MRKSFPLENWLSGLSGGGKKKILTEKDIGEEFIYHGAYPFAVIDESSSIVLANNKMLMAFPHIQDKKLLLTEIIPGYDILAYAKLYSIGERDYYVITFPFKTKNYFAVSMIDASNLIANNCRPVIYDSVAGLIVIDNYDEVLADMQDESRALFIAVVERKINELSRKLGGISKKFDRDKFLLIFSRDKLEYLKESKFEILKQVREIHMGNSQPVTVSVGIGINGENLYESMEFARAAVDLALGRGGDQALIKDGDAYQFFGGNSPEHMKNTRVKARVKAFALEELLMAAERIIVMGHKNPDLDSLGSALGIYRIAKAFSKECHIVLNQVSGGIFQLHKRMMEEGGSEDIFITGEKALQLSSPTGLLVVVDTHRPEITESPELLQNMEKIVVFDHHRRSAEFIGNTVLTYHEPYASSTSELVTEMIQYVRGEVKLRPCEADGLLAGITVDTKNFMVNTGARTFEAAAFLRRKGADVTKIRRLFRNSLDDQKAKAQTIRDAEIFEESMAIAICPQAGASTVVAAAQAADELLNIDKIEASFVICQIRDIIYISARSFDLVNVHLIMEKLGGGGHRTIAGAQLTETTTEEAVDRIKRAIFEYMQESD